MVLQNIPKELKEVVRLLKNGKTPEPVSIREFLEWFDCQRRTRNNIAYIEERLSFLKVQTVPNYVGPWVDSPIAFQIAEAEEISSHNNSQTNSVDENPADISDPAFRIGNILSAQNPPVSVKPNASLEEAMTVMLTRGFSQLPVMSNERDVRGVISWTSIGARMVAKVESGDALKYSDVHHEVRYTASLFSAVKTIADHGYVLVRAKDSRICGIVTASDISLQFEIISKPFLLLSEIENNLRILLEKRITIDDVKKSCDEDYLPKNLSNLHQLTLGNYVRVLRNESNWNKVNLRMDRLAFCLELDHVNRIRNEVMHFSPDQIKDTDLKRLHDVSRMFETLRSTGLY